MAQFVLVTNGVTHADFEKAMEIKIRAQEKVIFIPQNSNNHGLQNQGMYSAKANPSAEEELLNFVRFESDQTGAIRGRNREGSGWPPSPTGRGTRARCLKSPRRLR